MDISPTASSSHAPNNRSQGNSSQRHHKNTNVHERQHKHKQQLLKTSNVSIPTSSRKQKRIGSGFKRVERFNYAKALLRSDHELEKLSRKIRSEINESELFELAQAAEMAAESGVANFSGRPSTFGSNQEKKKLANTTTTATATTTTTANTASNTELQSQSTDATTDSKSGVGDKATATIAATHHTSSRQIYSASHSSRSLQLQVNDTDTNETLLDHARAAAAAVVVGAAPPVQQLRTTRTNQRKPGRRSMRIASLRDVNEVIPQWKELHGHMRTHLYREKVDASVLVFSETETTASPSPNAVAAAAATSNNNNTYTNANNPSLGNNNSNDNTDPKPHNKSFFDRIARINSSLLPKFRSINKTPEKTVSQSESRDHHPHDSTSDSSSKPQETSTNAVPSVGGLSSTFPPHLSSGKKDPCRTLPPSVSGRPEIANGVNSGSSQIRSCPRKLESENDHHALLMPRFPDRPGSFATEALQVTKNSNGSPRRPGYGSPKIDRCNIGNPADTMFIPSSENSILGSPRDYRDASKPEKQIDYSPERKIPSSTVLLEHALTYSVSPLINQSSSRDFHSQFSRPSSPLSPSPSTPNSSVIPRRKDLGFSTPAHLRIIKRLHRNVGDEKKPKGMGNLEQSKSEDLQQVKNQDDACIATPATAAYSEFEPNSIVVENPSPRQAYVMTSPSLKEIETEHLAIPTIQLSKSDSNLHKNSRKFVRRRIRTQWQHGTRSSVDSPTTPTDSISKIVLKAREETTDFVCCETSSSIIDPVLESSRDESEDEESISKENKDLLTPSKLMSYIDPPHHRGTSIPRPIQSEALVSGEEHIARDNSVRKIQYAEAAEEKKSYDSSTSSFDSSTLQDHGNETSFDSKSPHSSLNLFPAPTDEKKEDDLITRSTPTIIDQKIVFLEPKTNNIATDASFNKTGPVSNLRNRAEKWELIPRTKSVDQEPLVAGRAIEAIDSNFAVGTVDNMSSNPIHKDSGSVARNHTRDANTVDNTYVCHSMSPTDSKFKAAVQKVQGVLSQLTLGSPKSQLELEDWKSDADNKEFLRNYFYCAKAENDNQPQDEPTNVDTTEAFDSSGNFRERLACTVPCNGRESPCYMFGIDTMCGRLVDLLPNEVNISSITKNQERHSTRGVPSLATSRDRASSISMGQIQRNLDPGHGIDFNRHHDQGTWLGTFQRVASERFNIQFQSDENELERSNHPFTPPCLSRRVLTTRSDSR
uniref:Uncharacterized protein n=1 Tax=Pseudo-nitzschia australis TaxID=44445 RepID=A0A7S4AJI5_9STRA